MPDKAHILEEIRRTAIENDGKALGIARFEQETGITRNDWFGKYWATWGDALVEAGYEPNLLQGAYDDEYVIETLARFIAEIGHYPSMGEIRLRARQDSDFPSHNVFNRVGKKAELAAKVVSAFEGRDGFEEVIEACRDVLEHHCNPAEQSNEESEEDVFGWVYLMKSGQHYKIGRTTSLGRREYDLSIQLPEKLERIHAIKTDDPAGIEGYWHRRFAKKRLNGEWFALSSADVTAFKRRKFM